MNLTKQPPRRPSNVNMGGIVALARMTDKSRATSEELEGAYKYGEISGLDRELLAFINMTADEFAAAAEELDDAALSELVLEKAQKSPEEIEAHNKEQLEREPADEMHRRLLVERLALYAPGNTEIKTVLASMELDDWGAFRDADLTKAPPRTPYLRSVLGIVALARMGDKARAAKVDLLGEYRYGEASSLDTNILGFLGIGQEDFMEGAYQNPNDIELGEWIRQRCERTAREISAFNAARTDGGRADASRQGFETRRAEICPERTDINTWFNLLDYDDEKSFGLVDLTRHPPRSPYSVDVGGVVALARMIDKGRAHNSDTLGDYWFGPDSGIDRGVLGLLGLEVDEFAAALKECPTDEPVVEWLGERLDKPQDEIDTFNQEMRLFGPSNERHWGFLRGAISRLDPSRTDIETFFALTVLDDQVSFARSKSSV
jgi:hypothetical protein